MLLKGFGVDYVYVDQVLVFVVDELFQYFIEYVEIYFVVFID